MRHRGSGHFVLIGIGAVFGMVAVVVLAGVIVVAAIAQRVPPLDKLVPITQGEASTVYYSDGSVIGLIKSTILREPIAGTQMPPYLRDATVAIEDQRFYQHGAVDYLSLARAALTDLTAGQTLQGGSTITMQLVRNLYLPDDKTFSYKVKEAVIAQRLEAAHSKSWILTSYLNDVPYGTIPTGPNAGQTVEGVQAASWAFFDQPASQDNLVQSALLAGLPQAPTEYNPFLYPAAARARRNLVLAKMAQLGYISQQSAAVAERSGLELVPNDHYALVHDNYVLDFIKQELIARYGKARVAAGGMKVYTTINPQLQALARKAIDGVLDLPTDPSAALVSENPANGYVDAMAQSGSYAQSQFNLATQAHRQPGSTFKAIVLADALAHGIDPFTTVYLSHTLPDGWLTGYPTYSVSIDGGGNLDAPLNLDEALVASDNTVFAQLAADLTEASVTKMAYALGVRTHLDSYPGGGARRPDLRRHAARDGQRLRDDRRRRVPQQADHHHQGRFRERACRLELGQALARRGAVHRCDRRGDGDPRAQRRVRHGHAVGDLLPERGEDRHHQRARGRLARRLHADAHDGRLDGLPEGRHLDDRRARAGPVRR